MQHGPATPAEAMPDQIAAVTAATLTDEAFAYGVAEFLCAELAQRDAEITELRAGLAELRAARRPLAEDLPPRPPGRWVMRKEAAYQSGKSEAWIRKWRDKGEIPSHPEGGHILVDLDAVLRLACDRAPLSARKKVATSAHDPGHPPR